MIADIGELVVRIRADSAQLQQELARAGATVKDSAGKMEGALGSLKDQFRELIPAITLAAFVEFGKRAIESADRIGDLAQRIGFAASTLSALEAPLEKTGSSIDDLAASVNLMNNQIGEAAKGNQEAIKAFDQLGLSVQKLKALTPEQQFYAITQALAGLKNQFEQTEAGRAIFGRGFAALIPLIKESNGAIREHIQVQKDLGNALSDEKIQRIKDFGDALKEAAIGAKNEFLSLFAAVLKVTDVIQQTVGTPASYGLAKVGYTPQQAEEMNRQQSFQAWLDKSKQLGYATQASFKSVYPYQFGPPTRDLSAKGSNAGILNPEKVPENTLKKYLADLQSETSALGESERAFFINRVEIEAGNKARADYENHLRSSKELLPDEKAQIDQLAGSFYDLKKAQEENARVAALMKDALSDSLADIAVNFKNLKDTATGAIQSIAREIIKAKITNPFSESIINALPSFNLGSLFGFADGGSPPVGVPSIVGERGPEIFVPNSAGTIIPNHALGGASLSFTQVIQVSPGVPELVNQQIREAAPLIAAQAHASVFAAMRKGGPESRITGLRN